ncbi:hypothetical protein D3C85_1821410 [compost metagenome]
MRQVHLLHEEVMEFGPRPALPLQGRAILGDEVQLSVGNELFGTALRQPLLKVGDHARIA